MGPISFVLSAYTYVLIAYVIIAWVPRMPEPLQPVARRLQGEEVEPVIAPSRRIIRTCGSGPLRRVLPPLRLGGVALDLSILVLFFAVSILATVVSRLGL